jgi:hypothetical protein
VLAIPGLTIVWFTRERINALDQQRT